jgi:hypothetical protein
MPANHARLRRNLRIMLDVEFRRALSLSASCGAILLAAFCACASPIGTGTGERLHLNPKFTVGQVLRYQISTRTTTTSNTTTPIVNAQGASQLKQTLLLQLRIEVLSVQPGTSGSVGTVRLRSTYEKANATSETDAYDPGAAALVDQFNKLEGRAVEFTIDSEGKISHVAGLDDLLANPVASSTVRSSMSGLSPGALFPKEGIVIGQKWSNEQPLENTPLAGLVRRTESTYVREETVATPAAPDATSTASSTAPSSAPTPNDSVVANGKAPASNAACAVIVTKFEILRHGAAHGDATPPDYVHNGLRTSGTWTGSGESLDIISMATGFVVRSTQTASQNMDFEIVSPSTGSKIHYVGQVETQSEITLLP